MNTEIQPALLFEPTEKDMLVANDAYLSFNVTLARLLGLNVAIILHELHKPLCRFLF